MLQQTRQLGQILASYAVDHDGHYPTGKSSTEIFQQLIDQNYVTDPSLFYVRMDGKTVATSNHLKAENVSYDVTDAVTQDDPDMLPIVFTTGYKIDYRAGAKPMLLPGGYTDGMAIFYKSNNAVFISASSLSIPQGFDPKGKTYRQLTPNGPLP
jgi:hypothetical protein